MPNNELLSYIQQRRQQAASDATIREELLKSGWQESAVAEALGVSTNPPASVPPSPAVPAPPSPAASTSVFPDPKKFVASLDPKTKSIISAVVLYSVIGEAIRGAGMFIAELFPGGAAAQLRQLQRAADAYGASYPRMDIQLFTAGGFMKDLVIAAIVGAIIGYIVATVWGVAQKNIAQYSGGILNTPFKIFFWPGLAFDLIPLLYGGMIFGFLSTGVIVASAVLGSYVFAKGVANTIKKYLPIS